MNNRNGDVYMGEKKEKKYMSLADIIVIQLIFCVLIGIGYFSVNLIYPAISAEIYGIYIKSATEESDGSIIEFINKTPLAVLMENENEDEVPEEQGDPEVTYD